MSDPWAGPPGQRSSRRAYRVVSPVHGLQRLKERLVFLAAFRADRQVMRDSLQAGRDGPAGELPLGELGDERQATLAVDLLVPRLADEPQQFGDFFLRERHGLFPHPANTAPMSS